jgi:AbrB family looped-hinge helix DNA binding protein
MRITSKGQVTIPQAIREAAGLLPGCEVEFRLEDGIVRLLPAPPRKGPSRGERIVRHLRGRGTIRMSTEEIMALTRGEG